MAKKSKYDHVPWISTTVLHDGVDVALRYRIEGRKLVVEHGLATKKAGLGNSPPLALARRLIHDLLIEARRYEVPMKDQPPQS